MWRCKECGEEVFEVQSKVREVISKINKKGISCEIVHKDKTSHEWGTFYRCDGCMAEDEWLEDIAEWVEE